VIVDHRDDLVAEPDVRIFAQQQGIAEQIEVVGRIAIALDDVFELVRDVVDAERRIETGLFQRLISAEAPAGDLTDQVEILLADRLRELMDDRGELAAGAEVHVLHGIDPEAIEIGVGDPELVAVA
jgi:hypothetical protein